MFITGIEGAYKKVAPKQPAKNVRYLDRIP
jgi:hypothetical protein